MTDAERIVTAIALSLTVHWAVLSYGMTMPAPDFRAASVYDDVPIDVYDFTISDAGLSLSAPMTIEQTVTTETSSAGAADSEAIERRREAMVQYMDSVSESIHAHRQIAGEGHRFIGNARIHFIIEPDGRFTGIALARSSGDEALDQDALNAVQTASGTIRRPPILGSQPIPVTMAVKYQRGL